MNYLVNFCVDIAAIVKLIEVIEVAGHSAYGGKKGVLENLNFWVWVGKNETLVKELTIFVTIHQIVKIGWAFQAGHRVEKQTRKEKLNFERIFHPLAERISRSRNQRATLFTTCILEGYRKFRLTGSGDSIFAFPNGIACRPDIALVMSCCAWRTISKSGCLHVIIMSLCQAYF